ncbi:hypothetical protein SAY86_014188 [Trapa natans]|uniref:Uncharacterized protein n=1 Tax=Trapa natans TaxID=22666 RepID=A0AAN7QQK6_TRANT|nr:hypothetical protein SAY86_014188 [Trapa natans]
MATALIMGLLLANKELTRGALDTGGGRRKPPTRTMPNQKNTEHLFKVYDLRNLWIDTKPKFSW